MPVVAGLKALKRSVRDLAWAKLSLLDAVVPIDTASGFDHIQQAVDSVDMAISLCNIRIKNIEEGGKVLRKIKRRHKNKLAMRRTRAIYRIENAAALAIDHGQNALAIEDGQNALAIENGPNALGN